MAALTIRLLIKYLGAISDGESKIVMDFKFLVIDANQPVETQQSVVRQLVASKIDLNQFLFPTP